MRKKTPDVPYTLITFFLFCTSSHHNIIQGFINPNTMNKNDVRLMSKISNRT